MRVRTYVRQGIEMAFGPRAALAASNMWQLSGARVRRHFAPHLRASNAELTTLRDRFSGDRCTIIGNGPSLNRTDLSLLAGEYTFGLNRIYLKFPTMGFGTTFHVCVNALVAQQFAAEIADLDCPRFTSAYCRRYFSALPAADRAIYLQSLPGPAFSEDVRRGVWQGSTVTFVALQLAFHMGFKHVTLVGVDHRFADSGPAHKEVRSTGPDQNHFDPNYFGAGTAWHLPDLATSEMAYRLARARFEAADRSITDCTVDGALTVFRKGDLSSELAR